MKKVGISLGLILFFCTLLLASLSWYLFQTPSPVSSDDPKDFSNDRAMAYVEEMAKAPHGVGSLRHLEVRDYLMAELEKLGFETELQENLLSAKSYGFNRLLYAQNVLARKKGSGNHEKSIALMAHYDSQPHTPGAADDIMAVASIIEAARALTASEFEHDLLLVISDGEEAGLVGAKVFVGEGANSDDVADIVKSDLPIYNLMPRGSHPWSEDIGLLLNFEARGHKGPVNTFEIFGNVDFMIPEYAKALSHPFANSVSYEVYKRMPNDTDFSVTKRNKIPGFNMALLGGHAAYHSMFDKPENLSRGSLQHMGQYALQLARHFDKVDLDQVYPPEKNEVIFFNPAGYFFVHFSVQYLLYGLVVCGIFILLSLVFGYSRKWYKVSELVVGVFLSLILLALAVGICLGVAYFLQLLNPSFAHFKMSGLYPLEWFALGFSFLLFALFIFFNKIFLRLCKPYALQLAGLLIWFSFALASFFFLKGASYLFLYPLLFMSFASFLAAILGFDFKMNRKAYAVLSFVAAIPVFLFLTPIISLLHDTFGIYLVLVPALLTGLLYLLLSPLFDVFSRSATALLTVFCLLVSVAFFAGAPFYFAPSEKYPTQSSMIYFEDADQDKAWWASEFSDTDFWNEHYLKDTYDPPSGNEWLDWMRIAADAPMLGQQAPELTVVVDTVIMDRDSVPHRMVEARIQFEEDVAYAGFDLKKDYLSSLLLPSNEIDDSIQNIFWGAKPSDFMVKSGLDGYVQLMGLPDNRRLHLAFQCDPEQLIEFSCYSQKIGLPEELLDKPMPPEVIPGTGYLSHINIFKKNYSIP